MMPFMTNLAIKSSQTPQNSFNIMPRNIVQSTWPRICAYRRDRPWMQRPCLFQKVFNLKSPSYLHVLIPSITRFYASGNNANISSFNCRTEYCMNSFLPHLICEWDKLDIKITNFIHLESIILLGCSCQQESERAYLI